MANAQAAVRLTQSLRKTLAERSSARSAVRVCTVDESGLVFDAPVAAAPPPVPTTTAGAADYDTGDAGTSGKKAKNSGAGGGEFLFLFRELPHLLVLLQLDAIDESSGPIDRRLTEHRLEEEVDDEERARTEQNRRDAADLFQEDAQPAATSVPSRSGAG